jgi:hypothetical protein
VGWAHAAGLSEVEASASAWCFATSVEVPWWSETWAERLSHFDFGRQAVERELTTSTDLAQLADGWP